MDLSDNKKSGAVWNSISEQYSKIPEDRIRILSPIIFELLEKNNINSIVDFGGGDGRFLNNILKNAGKEIPDSALVEPAKKMRLIALENNKYNYKIVKSVNELHQNSWDLVIQIAVWMCLPNRQSCLKALEEINKLLKKGGIFFAAVTHPCFRDEKFRTYQTDFDMKYYLENGKQFNVEIGRDNQKINVTDTHWNLEEMSSQLFQNNFLIRRLFEPKDVKEDSIGSPWLIIEAIKF